MKLSSKKQPIQSPKKIQKPVPKQIPKEEVKPAWQNDGYLRVKSTITHQTQQINRPLTLTEKRQIDFLESVQQKAYQNLEKLSGETVSQVLAINQPPLALECAMLALLTLFEDNENSLNNSTWAELQEALRDNENEFLKSIEKYQDLTVNSQFERQNIIRAKNHLLRYIVEEQIIQSYSDKYEYNEKIKFIICLAENIIAFIEVYDALMKSFMLEEIRYTPRVISEKPSELPQIDESYNEQSKLEHSKLEHSKMEPETKTDESQQAATVKKQKPQSTTPLGFHSGGRFSSNNNPRVNKQAKSPKDPLSVSQNDNYRDSPINPRIETPKSNHNRILSAKQRVELRISAKVRDEKSPKPTLTLSPERKASNSKEVSYQDLTNGKIIPPPAPSVRGSQTDPQNMESRDFDIQNEDDNIQNLRGLIEKNKLNIKQLMSEQMDLKFKIEKESEQLQRHMEELVLRDEKIRQMQLQKELQLQQRTKISNSRTGIRNQVKSPGITQKRSQKQKVDSSLSMSQQQQPPLVQENASFENLRKDITQSEKDQVNLENELNRLLKIIDEKSKSLSDQSRISPKNGKR